MICSHKNESLKSVKKCVSYSFLDPSETLISVPANIRFVLILETRHNSSPELSPVD